MADVVPSAHAYARENVLRGIKRGWFPSPEEITPEWVAKAFSEAGKTLVAIRVTGTKPADAGCAWPDIVREHIEAYGWSGQEVRPAIPSSKEVEWMEQVYSWLGLLPNGRKLWRRIVGLRGLTHPIKDKPIYSWQKISGALGCAAKSAENWYQNGLEILAKNLRQIIEKPSGVNSPEKSTNLPTIAPEPPRHPPVPNNKVLFLFPQGTVVASTTGEMFIVWSVTLGLLHVIPLIHRAKIDKYYLVPGLVVLKDGEHSTCQKLVADCSERRHFHPYDVAKLSANIGDMLPLIASAIKQIGVVESVKAAEKKRKRRKHAVSVEIKEQPAL